MRALVALHLTGLAALFVHPSGAAAAGWEKWYTATGAGSVMLFGVQAPEAYQRLLLDCMLGDATLFIRQDEVEAAWALVTPILQAWEAKGKSGLTTYAAGTWGPPAADVFIARDGREWATF